MLAGGESGYFPLIERGWVLARVRMVLAMLVLAMQLPLLAVFPMLVMLLVLPMAVELPFIGCVSSASGVTPDAVGAASVVPKTNSSIALPMDLPF